MSISSCQLVVVSAEIAHVYGLVTATGKSTVAGEEHDWTSN